MDKELERGIERLAMIFERGEMVPDTISLTPFPPLGCRAREKPRVGKEPIIATR
jgi:hypothetical protein